MFFLLAIVLFGTKALSGKDFVAKSETTVVYETMDSEVCVRAKRKKISAPVLIVDWLARLQTSERPRPIAFSAAYQLSKPARSVAPALRTGREFMLRI